MNGGGEKEQNMTNIGIVGLGSMGLGMALSIARQGLRITGFDLNPAALARLVEGGGIAATSAANAAQKADILIVVVVNEEGLKLSKVRGSVTSPMTPGLWGRELDQVTCMGVNRYTCKRKR